MYLRPGLALASLEVYAQPILVVHAILMLIVM